MQGGQVAAILQQYIQENLHGDLSLTSLAGVVYLNPSYMSRLYKQLTGIKITDYINSVRIETAKKILCEGEHRIQDIAARVGFDSASYFSVFFKRITGMTPQEYRKTVR